MSLDRAAVRDALTPELVAAHYGIEGRWLGKWMRSRQCPITVHASQAFGISRDGMWHCWSCDQGGDLLDLVAAGEALDIKREFGDVLEVAAAIAGVVDEDSFGAATPKPRAPRPAVVEDRAQRISIARIRAKWLWLRLDPRLVPMGKRDDAGEGPEYLRRRGLDPMDLARMGESIRFAPAQINPIELAGREELQKTRAMFAPPAVCLPVRSIIDNELTDVRTRRLRPREGEPKILGMPGGVTWPDGELAGCYGRPASLGLGDVILVEGWADYLAARLAWPEEDVLGAVDAGQLRAVAGFAAAHCADVGSRLVMLVHHDGDEDEAIDKGKPSPAGAVAADRATVTAIRAGLAPSDLLILDCLEFFGVKDLAELAPHRGGLDEARDALANLLGRA